MAALQNDCEITLEAAKQKNTEALLCAYCAQSIEERNVYRATEASHAQGALPITTNGKPAFRRQLPAACE